MRELRRLLLEPSRLGSPGATEPPVVDRLDARSAGCGDRRPAQGPPLALLPEESHYLARVLRLRLGDRLAIGDGKGRLWSARLESATTVRLEQPLASPWQQAPPPRPRLTLALATPRRDPEVVWRMATELGACTLQPLVAARSVVRGEAPLQRWRAIVREASEQSERLWLPQLAPALPATSWLAVPRDMEKDGPGFLATTRHADCRPLAHCLSQILGVGGAAREPAALSVAIGPEGGWSPEEESLALAAGWQLVSLGDGILRSSTAAVAALALLALGWDQLRT